jgi:hypothetical protein
MPEPTWLPLPSTHLEQPLPGSMRTDLVQAPHYFAQTTQLQRPHHWAQSSQLIYIAIMPMTLGDVRV